VNIRAQIALGSIIICYFNKIHNQTWISSSLDDRIITQKITEEFMRASSFIVISLIALCLIYAGCEKSENKSDSGKKASTAETVEKDVTKTADDVGEGAKEAVEDVTKKSEEMHGAQVEELRKKAPSEVAAELWNLIQTEEYENWKSMPGTNTLDKDAAEKKAYFKTYMNSTAVSALDAKSKSLPPGSIIVKEKYDDQDQLQTISAMMNLGGSDPKDLNWFWAQYSPAGKPLKWGETGKGVKSAQ
jgi:hypothetical protein